MILQDDDQKEEKDEDIDQLPKSGVVVISLRELVIFTVTNGSFSQIFLPFDTAQEEG